MAQIDVAAGTVTVRLTAGERFSGLHGDFSFSTRAVTSATAVADPIRELRGTRLPGLGLPNRRIGIWRWGGHKDFVSVTRGHAGLVLELDDDQEFRRVILSLPDADQVVAQLAPTAGS